MAVCLAFAATFRNPRLKLTILPPHPNGGIHRQFSTPSIPNRTCVRAFTSVDKTTRWSLRRLPGISMRTSISTTTLEQMSPQTHSESILSINQATEINRATKVTKRREKPLSDFVPASSNITAASSTRHPRDTLLPPLTTEEYDPKHAVSQIIKASGWNQGRVPGELNSSIANRKYRERKWDYDFVRSAVDSYQRHLQYVLDHLNAPKKEKEIRMQSSSLNDDLKQLFSEIHPTVQKCTDTSILLAPSTLASAVRALTRTKLDSPILSKRIRDIERLIGLIGWTPITDDLSYRLLEANGKAGNVRRTLALLELRRKRGYPPRERSLKHNISIGEQREDTNTAQQILPGEKEFIHAITSIEAAQLPLRRSRNIYLHESSFSETSLDNPTRYLDAILINMSQRGVSLRPSIAARMLNCYSSTGRTGRALHYFYKVVRDPIEEDGVYIPGPHPTHLGKSELEEWKERRRVEGLGRAVAQSVQKESCTTHFQNNSNDDSVLMKMKDCEEVVTKNIVRMNMHPPPPFHKIPSAVKGAYLTQNKTNRPIAIMGKPESSLSSSSMLPSTFIKDKVESTILPHNKDMKSMTKYEWELERGWSLALTAAFAFADSLTHGACGHEPIELDIVAWNSLIKACCYRGAFHRALKILNETMPQKSIEPDSFSYNTILAGLARVGDITSLKELLVNMTNKNVTIDKYTVQAMADGLLNIGDISGASSMVQDIFNQHDALPPYTTHLKILEFALSNGLIYEAKRHVYFIQQLWKWQPTERHPKKFCEVMEATKRNPKLSKDSLQKLFQYFGEDLNESVFF